MGTRTLRPKCAGPGRPLGGSGLVQCHTGSQCCRETQNMVPTSHSPSSMPPWLPFYACQEGSAVATTILILKLHRLHTRPIIFPLQPALLPGSTAQYVVPHPPVQTRNSSIILDTSLLFSCKPLSPVNATSAVVLEFVHLLPLLPPPESRQPSSPTQTIASAS